MGPNEEISKSSKFQNFLLRIKYVIENFWSENF